MHLSQRTLVFLTRGFQPFFLSVFFVLLSFSSSQALQKKETAFFIFFYEKETGTIIDLIHQADSFTRRVKTLTGFEPREVGEFVNE